MFHGGGGPLGGGGGGGGVLLLLLDDDDDDNDRIMSFPQKQEVGDGTTVRGIGYRGLFFSTIVFHGVVVVHNERWWVTSVVVVVTTNDVEPRMIFGSNREHVRKVEWMIREGSRICRTIKKKNTNNNR